MNQPLENGPVPVAAAGRAAEPVSVAAGAGATAGMAAPQAEREGEGGGAARFRGERPWPGVVAMLTAPWLPATTARRTKDLPLVRAFGVHVLAALLTVVLIIMLAGISRVDANPFWVVWEVLQEIGRNVEAAVMAAVITIVLIEGGLLALAVLVTPWGARDERPQDSFRSGLRQTWLHCGHALPVVLAIGLLVIAIASQSNAYFTSPVRVDFTVPYPTPPTMASEASADSDEWNQAWEEFQAAQAQHAVEVAEWQQAWQAHWQQARVQQPFLVRYGELIAMQMSILAAVWILWSLLRGVGAERGVTPIGRAPMCETCGYNLTGTAPDGRCPECGRGVQESLRPEARPGTAWERRDELGRLRAYGRSVADTFRQPRAPGERVEVLSFRDDHRLLMGVNLGVALILGWAITAMTLAIAIEADFYVPMEFFILGVAPIMTVFGVFGILGFAGICVVIVAVTYQVRIGRNLAHVAARAAAHHSFWLVVWAVAAAGQALVLVVLEEQNLLTAWSGMLQMDLALFVMSCIIGLHLAMGIMYLFLIFRGTSGARYANR